MRPYKSSKVITAITNVTVFDGLHILERVNAIGIDSDGLITFDTHGAVTTIDGNGGFLLPGLIDGHTHANSTETLDKLASYGVTSTVVASCTPPETCLALAGHAVGVLYSGASAMAPGSQHANLHLGLANETIDSIDDVPDFVDRQIDIGASQIKIVADNPGTGNILSQDILDALVDYTHTRGLRAIIHAAGLEAFRMAQAAGVDHVHHVPQDVPLDDEAVGDYVSRGLVSIPTLTVALTLEKLGPLLGLGDTHHYNASSESVQKLYAAGVPILAGTDASAYVPFGSSLHQELELLVGTGMTELDALRAATAYNAMYTNWEDRGRIWVGNRADLVLVGGNPITNISVTRDIKRIWIGGKQYRSYLESD
ncbi:hypothetical protein DL96DRAFT_1216494 [Flagelloscypha sp. PMI_526]|nr:hypothetical protein DL96DRAFT_1216494 [Flagelloscypha sp. PMI_526]